MIRCNPLLSEEAAMTVSAPLSWERTESSPPPTEKCRSPATSELTTRTPAATDDDDLDIDAVFF